MKQKVLLYNPKAVFFDMPLALLAIGSALDADKYEVVIIDGRITEDVNAALDQYADNAICLGVTCLTGAPLKDAYDVSQKFKESHPGIPVVWGGWHTSLLERRHWRNVVL